VLRFELKRRPPTPRLTFLKISPKCIRRKAPFLTQEYATCTQRARAREKEKNRWHGKRLFFGRYGLNPARTVRKQYQTPVFPVCSRREPRPTSGNLLKHKSEKVRETSGSWRDSWCTLRSHGHAVMYNTRLGCQRSLIAKKKKKKKRKNRWQGDRASGPFEVLNPTTGDPAAGAPTTRFPCLVKARRVAVLETF
jgi:hypothetical protein